MNTTVTSQSNASEVDDLDCSRFTFNAYVIVFGFMCVFGLVGNGLSWVVLSRERHNSGRVATFLLQTMAVIDNLFLITAGISHITAAVILYVESSSTSSDPLSKGSVFSVTINGLNSTELLPSDIDNFTAISSTTTTSISLPSSAPAASVVTGAYIQAYVMVCVWPLVHVTQLSAVWITVLVAFNRYIAICRPFQAHQLCTMRQTRLQAAVLGFAILVYNIPRFLEYRIDYVANEDYGDHLMPQAVPTSLKKTRVYNVVYENLLYTLFVFLGPLLILIGLNACLVHELVLASRRFKERRLPADSSTDQGEQNLTLVTDLSTDQGEQNLTLVMVVIILIFLVCQSPAFANQLLFYLIENQFICGKAYFYYFHISNLLATANSSVNFVVYCVFRKQFRRRLHKFCCGDRQQDHNRRYGNCPKDPNKESIPMNAR